MENYLSGAFREKTKKELCNILENVDKYQEYAIIEAITELERRGEDIEHYAGLRADILEVIKNRDEKAKDIFEHHDDLTPSIRKASYLIFLSIFLGMISIFISEHYLNAGNFSTFKGLLTLSLSLLLAGILAYLILAGRVVARSLFLIFFLAGTVSTIPALLFLFATNIAISLFTLVPFTLQLYSLILLYNRESNEWYRKQKAGLTVPYHRYPKTRGQD